MPGYPCVSYLLLCNKLSQNIVVLKSNHLSSWSFLRSGIKERLSQAVLLRFFHEVASKMSARTAVTWRLTWVWRFHPSMTLSHACGKEAYVPPYVNLSVGLLECPHNMVGDIPQSKWEGVEGTASVFFITQSQKSHIVFPTIFIRNESWSPAHTPRGGELTSTP